MYYRRGCGSSSQRWERPVGSSNAWVRPGSQTASTSTAAKHQGPVLRGGPRQLQHKTWKRGTQETTIASTRKEAAKAPPSTDTVLVKKAVDASKLEETAFRRRGRNKLVLKQLKEHKEAKHQDTEQPAGVPHDEPGSAVAAKKVAKQKGSNQFAENFSAKDRESTNRTFGVVTLGLDDSGNVTSTKMKKRGRNQHVLASKSEPGASTEDVKQQVDTGVTLGTDKSDHVTVKLPLGGVEERTEFYNIPHMKKRGRIQLVLEKEVKEESKAQQDNGKLLVEVERPATSLTPANIKKRGRNQLTPDNPIDAVSDKPVQEKRKTNKEVVADMAKRGRNKLVLRQHAEDEKSSLVHDTNVTADSKIVGGRVARHGTQGGHSRRGRAFRSPGVSAKRIKLNVTEEPEGLEEINAMEMLAHCEGVTDEKQQKTLTEFAYRETSKKAAVRGRKHHGWVRGAVSKQLDPKGRNMGLVRVVPDVAKTRVCPTFARGVPCENEKCKMRHDVPKEAATPICSFFQRNGQCMKRDTCLFRHVKINARTTVCPSFSLLGFCQDTECRMKHVRQQTNHSIKRSDASNKT